VPADACDLQMVPGTSRARVRAELVRLRGCGESGSAMAQSPRKAANVAAYDSHSDGALSAPLGPHPAHASLRQQIAVVRTLLDELDDSVPSSGSLPQAPDAQVIDELIRLGCRVLDSAALLAERYEAEREENQRYALYSLAHAPRRPGGKSHEEEQEARGLVAQEDQPPHRA